MSVFPNTPAGQLMARFFDAFNRGDVQFVHDFVAAHYADPLADPGPQEDQAVWNSLDYTTSLVMALEHDPSCGLQFHSIERDKPDEVAVLVQCGLAGEWVFIKMRTALDEPTHLIELRTRPALMPPNASHDQAPTETELTADLDRFLTPLCDADIFAGVALVAKNGERIYERAFGLASREFDVPNWIDTKFNVGSLNKMFTGVGIAQLVERGMLSHEDTLAQRLPEFPHPAADRITLHHLLSHLSGIGSYWNERFEANRARIRTVSDFLALFSDQPPVYQPDERWYYSNGGYVILGAIIERVTGQDYYDFMRESVYYPAGMEHTDAYEVDRPIPNLAVGYTHINYAGLRELGEVRNNLFIHVIKGGPGGGGFSTAEDLLRFDQALRNNILLDANSTERLLNGKVEVRGPTVKYAYGFYDRLINGQRVVGHHGNFPGLGPQFDMYLDSGYTVVILTNSDPAVSQIVADHLRDLLTRKEV